MKAVEHRNEVLDQILADPQPSWTELRTLAQEMAEAEVDELAQLEAATWPANAQDPISALKGDIRSAIPFWNKAAVAVDEDALYENINLALEYCGGPAAGEVRVALGLPTAG